MTSWYYFDSGGDHVTNLVQVEVSCAKFYFLLVKAIAGITIDQNLLQIHSLTASDQGSYTCQANINGLSDQETISVKVIIQKGPQVHAREKKITRAEGGSADLVCRTNSANRVSWRWLHDGTLLSTTEDMRITIEQNFLQIHSLTASDQGSYTCQANMNGLSNQETISVKVIIENHSRLQKELDFSDDEE